jgi:putative Mg2+ transporter-C (MgtC) family protein
MVLSPVRWLTEDWHGLLPQPWASAAQVFVALLCGGIIGVERERKQKSVGFRTLALVSLGSTVFTMIGSSIDHRSPIAAQVVSGIGFLGAGVILRGPFGITGLTSAATIWAMAAVGMTVGIGYGGAALALSGFILLAMLLVAVGEQRYIGPCRYREAILTFQSNGGKSAIKIEEVLDEYRFPAGDYRFSEAPADVPAASAGRAPSGRLRLRYCDVHRRHREFLAFLAAMPEVADIQRGALDAPVDFNQT